MRTVTFSNQTVANFINRNYVPAWHNRGPGFHDEELSTENSISKLSAYATRNIVTFFLRPDGRVFFYAAGYYPPKSFLEILKFARKPGQDYRERARNMEIFAKQAEEEYRDFSMAEACSHIAEVLHEFADREELPQLSEIQFNYRFGNRFSEEPPDGGRTPVPSSVFTSPRTEVSINRTALSPAPQKLEELRRAFDERSTQLGKQGLDEKVRQSIQNELVKIADEMMLCQARLATREKR